MCGNADLCRTTGKRGYQFQDARTYAEWGVDYLKYDWCFDEGQNPQAAYKTMSDALKASGRPIVFSICEWGNSQPWTWAKASDIFGGLPVTLSMLLKVLIIGEDAVS